MSCKRPRLSDDCVTSVLFEIAPVSVVDLASQSFPCDVYQIMDYINENNIDPRSFLVRPELLASLGVDSYWILHINGVLAFDAYICATTVDSIASFISTSLCTTGTEDDTTVSPTGNVGSAVAGALVQYLWEHCDSSSSWEGPAFSIQGDVAGRCRAVLNHLSNHYFYAWDALGGASGELAAGEEKFSLLCRVCAIAATTVATNSSSAVAEAVLEWEARQLCLLAGCDALHCPSLYSRGGAVTLVAVLHPRALITSLDQTLRRRPGHSSRSVVGAKGAPVDGLCADHGLVALVSTAVAIQSGEGSSGLQGEVIGLCHRVCRLGLEALQASTERSSVDVEYEGLCGRSVSFMVLLQQWAWTRAAPEEAAAGSRAGLGEALYPFIYDMLLVAINMSYNSCDMARASAPSASVGAGGVKRQSCFSLLLSTVLARAIDQLVANPSAATEETLQQIYRAVRALKRDLQESEASPLTATAPGSVPKASGRSVSSANSVAINGESSSVSFNAAVPVAVLHAFWTLDRKPHRAAINQTLMTLKAALDGRFDPLKVNCLSVVPGATATSEHHLTVAGSLEPTAAVETVPAAALTVDVSRDMLMHWRKCIESTAMLPVGVLQLCQKFAPAPTGGGPTADRELYAVSCFRQHIAASPALRPVCRLIADAMLTRVAADTPHGRTASAAARSLSNFLAESKTDGVCTSASKQEAPPVASTAGKIERVVDSHWMRLLDKAVRSSGVVTSPHVVRCYKELCAMGVCFGQRALVAAGSSDESSPMLGYTCAGACLLTQLRAAPAPGGGSTGAANEGTLSASDDHLVSRLSYCFKQLIASSRTGDGFSYSMCKVLLLLMVQLVDQVLANQDRLGRCPLQVGSPQKTYGRLSPLHLPHHYRAYWDSVLAKLARIWAGGCDDAASYAASPTTLPAAASIATDALTTFVRCGKLKLPLCAVDNGVSADVDLLVAVRTSYTLEALLTVLGHVATADTMRAVMERLFLQSGGGGSANATAAAADPVTGPRLLIVLRALLQVMPDTHRGSEGATRQLVHWYFTLLHAHLGGLHGPTNSNETRALLLAAATQECLMPSVSTDQVVGPPVDTAEVCRRLTVLRKSIRQTNSIVSVLRCYQSSSGGLVQAVEVTDRWVELCLDAQCARRSDGPSTPSAAASTQDMVVLAGKLFQELLGWQRDANMEHARSGQEQTDTHAVALCTSYLLSALRSAGNVGGSAACEWQKVLLNHWCGRSAALLAKLSCAPADHAARLAIAQAVYFTCVRVVEMCQDSSSRLLAEACGGWAAVLYEVMCLVYPTSGAVDSDADTWPSHLGLLGPSPVVAATTTMFAPVQAAVAWWRQCCCRQGTGMASNMGVKLLLQPQSAVARPCTAPAPSALACFQSCCLVARSLAVSSPTPSGGSCYSHLASIVLVGGEVSAGPVDELLQSAAGRFAIDSPATVARMAVYCALSGDQDSKGQPQWRQWSLTTVAVLIRTALLCKHSPNTLAPPALLVCLEMVISCAFWLTFRGRDSRDVVAGAVDARELIPALHRLVVDLRNRAVAVASDGHGAWVRTVCQALLSAAPHPPPSSVCVALLPKIEKDAESASVFSGTTSSQNSQNAFRNITNMPAGTATTTNSQKSTETVGTRRVTNL